MTLLLDSHMLLWWLADDSRLSPLNRELIGSDKDEILVSAITLAELSIKASLGRLEVPPGLNEEIVANGFEFLPFDERHAAALRDLPFHHRNPFDPMLICQAQVDGLVFLTTDPQCEKYDIHTR